MDMPLADPPAPDDTIVEEALPTRGELDFRLIELFFFAYREFTGDADSILERYGFGRAHHRILHFVNRDPGMTIAEILDLLEITKQSLSRVLRQLIDDGFIAQVQGTDDRRQRRSTRRRKAAISRSNSPARKGGASTPPFAPPPWTIRAS